MGITGITRKRWTANELKFLSENYGKLSVADVASALGRTVHGIHWKAAQQDVKFEEEGEDGAYLSLLKRLEAAEASVLKLTGEVDFLKKQVRAIETTTSSGGYRRARLELSKEEETFIEQNFREMSNDELAIKLDVTQKAVKKFLWDNHLIRCPRWDKSCALYRDGVRSPAVQAWAKHNRKRFANGELSEYQIKKLKDASFEFEDVSSAKKRGGLAPQEERFIRENYKRYDAHELALKLGVSYRAVRAFKRENHLYMRLRIKRLPLTPEGEDYIRDNFRNYTATELASRLNVSVKVVQKFKHHNELNGLRARFDEIWLHHYYRYKAGERDRHITSWETRTKSSYALGELPQWRIALLEEINFDFTKRAYHKHNEQPNNQRSL